nr:PREDICTED: uncharacterized protein LOC105676648 [Linepithema humile]
MLYDNRRRSAQWLDANEPPKHMPKPNLYPKKIMVSVWSSKGIVHYSFLKQGEAINADKYCQEIDIMYQKLRAQQPALVNRHGALLLHDNTKPHIAKKTRFHLLFHSADCSRKIVVNKNVTIRPLVQGNYYIFFDPQHSPAYEIIFSLHLLTGIAIYIVTASVCGVTALFTMHACGQLEMLVTWLENLANENHWSKEYSTHARLALIIAHHVRVRRYKML